MNALGARLGGRFEVDEWGYDDGLARAVVPLLGFVLRVEADGFDGLPADGPALLVANRRLGLAEPAVLARAVRRDAGRGLRFLGIPDVAPVGPALRRLGGAVERPGELAGLLRAGHAVVVFATRTWQRGRVGAIGPELLAPVSDLGLPAWPVAVVGGELTGRWRVAAGGPVAAATVRERLEALLDRVAPARWLLG